MHLIRVGKYAAAEKSFRYYKNIKDSDNINDQNRAMEEFEDMKVALKKGNGLNEAITLKDFCKLWERNFPRIIINHIINIY